MENANLDEIKSLLKKKIVIPIPEPTNLNPEDLQKLKWVRTIKTSTADASKTRHRDRLVSAPNLSVYRHSVHGNAPTIALSSCRIMIYILPTWIDPPISKHDKLTIFIRDKTKEFLQIIKSKRQIIYLPFHEFFTPFPQYVGHLRKNWFKFTEKSKLESTGTRPSSPGC